MNIAIIGAGFTGLAAAQQLRARGHTVHILEQHPYPGGLASGFTQPHWQWSLEHHYHHIFTTDTDIIDLARSCRLDHLITFTSTKTSILYHDHLYPFDSPLAVITFPHLSLLSKVRTAIGLARLRFSSHWRPYETTTAYRFIRDTQGREVWRKIWQPLFAGKFGRYEREVNAAWFWARIKVRSQKLGYFTGGFLAFAQALADHLIKEKVLISYGAAVSRIIHRRDGVYVRLSNHRSIRFDAALITAPSPILLQIVPSLPPSFTRKLSQLKSLAAQTLILEMDRPFFTDNTYWLNINQTDWPFLAVVEHTHFMPSRHYGGKHLLYVGKYLDLKNPQYQLSKRQLMAQYHPFLEKISPSYAKHICHSWLYQADFAQPVVARHHSQNLPPLKTPLPGIYWASMQHIYPFDRGTNYAVKLGRQAADLIHEENISHR